MFGLKKQKYNVSDWTKADEKLMLCTKKGELTHVQSCLKKGTDPAKLEPTSGSSAMHEAATTGNKDIIEALLSVNSPNVNVKDSTGKTPVCYAAAKGHTDAALLFLRAHADANALDAEGLSPMHHATQGNMDCVVILLKYRAQHDLRDKHGRTPLSMAACNGQASVCKLLLDNGAEVNNVDSRRNTPLIGAAEKGNAQLCQFLLDNGADPRVVNGEGKTAYHYAVDKNYTDVQKVLNDALANPSHGAERRRRPTPSRPSRPSSQYNPAAPGDDNYANPHQFLSEAGPESPPVEAPVRAAHLGASSRPPGGQTDPDLVIWDDRELRRLLGKPAKFRDPDELVNAVENLCVKNAELRAQAVDQSRELDTLKQRLADDQRETDQRKAELERIRRDQRDIEASLARQNAIVAEKDDQFHQLRQNYDTTRDENEALQKDIENFRAYLAAEQRQHRNTNEKSVTNDAELNKLRAEISAMREEIERNVLEHGSYVTRVSEPRLTSSHPVDEVDSDEIVQKRDELLVGNYKLAADLQRAHDEILAENEYMRNELNKAHSQPRDAGSKDALLRMEIAAIRAELENNAINRGGIAGKHKIDSPEKRMLEEKDEQLVELQRECQQTQAENATLNNELDHCKALLASEQLQNNAKAAPQRNDDENNRLRLEIAAVRDELEKKILSGRPPVVVRSEERPLQAIPLRASSVPRENDVEKRSSLLVTSPSQSGINSGPSDADMTKLRIEIAGIRDELEKTLLVQGKGLSRRDEEVPRKQAAVMMEQDPRLAELQQANRQLQADNDRLMDEVKKLRAASRKPESLMVGQNNDQLNLLRLEIAGIRGELERKILEDGSMAGDEPIKKQNVVMVQGANRPDEQETIRQLQAENDDLNRELDKLQVQLAAAEHQKAVPHKSDDDAKLRIEIAAIRDELEKEKLQRRAFSGNQNDDVVEKKSASLVQSVARPTEPEREHRGPAVAESPQSNEALQKQLNQLRLEIAALRDELEHKVLERGPQLRNPEEKIQRQSAVAVQSAEKPIAQQMIHAENPNETAKRDVFEDQLKKIRIEMAVVRDELERGVLERGSETPIQKQNAVLVSAPRPVEQDEKYNQLLAENDDLRKQLDNLSQPATREIPDSKDDQLNKLRVEITHIREELESGALERGTPIQKQNAVLVSAPKPVEQDEKYKQLLADNDNLKRQLDSQSQNAMKDKYDPTDDQLNKLRIEITGIREELEHRAMEQTIFYDCIDGESIDKEKAVMVSSGERPNDDAKDEELRQLRAYITSNDFQKASKSDLGNDEKLRVEIAAIRDELEKSILGRGPYPGHREEEAAVVKKENVLLVHAAEKPVATEPQQQGMIDPREQEARVNKLRVEIAALRDELEDRALQTTPRHFERKESQQSAALVESAPRRPESTVVVRSPEPQHPVDDRQLKKLRVEMAAVRDELEKTVLELNSFAEKKTEDPIERQSAVVVTKAAKPVEHDRDYQKLLDENDALRKEVERLKTAGPKDGDLNKIRIEMAAVRDELENSILEHSSMKEPHSMKEPDAKRETAVLIRADKPTQIEEARPKPPQSRDDSEELNKIRREVVALRDELERRVVEQGPIVRPHETETIQKNASPMVQTAAKPAPQQTHYEPSQPDREDDRLNKLRVEIAAIRDEMEKGVLKRGVSRDHPDEDVVIKQAAVVVSAPKPVEPDRQSLVGASNRDEEMNKLRVEISAIRDELEGKALEHAPAERRENAIVVKNVEKSPELQQLRDENERLKQELDNLKAQMAAVERQRSSPIDSDQLNKLRVEIAAVRDELERKALERPLVEADKVERRSAVVVTNAKPFEQDRAYEQMQERNDDLSKELNVLKQQLASRSNTEPCDKLRVEIAAVRDELEKKVLEQGLCVPEKPADRVEKQKAAIVQSAERPIAQATTSAEYPNAKIEMLEDQLQKIRVEMAAVRDELERGALKRSPPIQKQNAMVVNSAVKPVEQQEAYQELKAERDELSRELDTRRRSPGSDDQLSKLREEVAAVRDELEKSVMTRGHAPKDSLDGEKVIKESVPLVQSVGKSSAVKENYPWQDQSNEQLNRLRLEIAAVRGELEKEILERGSIANQPNDDIIQREPSVLVQSAVKSTAEALPAASDPSQQLNRLRAEIAAVRDELEAKAVERGSQPVPRDTNLDLELFRLKADNREKEKRIDALTKQMTDEEENLSAQLADFRAKMKELEEKKAAELQLLERQRDRLKSDLNEKNDELLRLNVLKKASLAEKDRELNKLVAENDYLNNEIRKLRQAAEEELKAEPVKAMKTDSLRAGRPVTGYELNSDGDSDEERTWQEVEKSRSMLRRLSEDCMDGDQYIAPDREPLYDARRFEKKPDEKTEEWAAFSEKLDPVEEARLNLQLDALRNENAKLHKKIVDSELAMDDRDRQLSDLGQQLKDYGRIVAERDRLKKDLEKMREFEKEKEDLTKVKKRNSQLMDMTQELQADIDRHEQTIADKDKKLEDAQKRLQDLKNQMDEQPIIAESTPVLRLSRPSSFYEPEELDEMRRKLKRVDSEKEKLKDENEELREKLDKKEALMGLLIAPIATPGDDPQSSPQELEEEVKRLKVELKKAASDAQALRQEKSSVDDELEANKRRNVENIAKLTADIEGLRAKVRKLESDFDIKDAELAEEKRRNADKLNRLEESERRSADEARVVGIENIRLGHELERLFALTRDAEGWKQRLQQADQSLEQMKTEQEDLMDLNHSLKADVAKRARDLNAAQEEYMTMEENLNEEIRKLKDSARKLSNELADQNSFIETLQEEKTKAAQEHEAERTRRVSADAERDTLKANVARQAGKIRELEQAQDDVDSLKEHNTRIRLENKELIDKLEQAVKEQQRLSGVEKDLVEKHRRLTVDVENNERESRRVKEQLQKTNAELEAENSRLQREVNRLVDEGRKNDVVVEKKSAPLLKTANPSSTAAQDDEIRALTDANARLTSDLADARQQLGLAQLDAAGAGGDGAPQLTRDQAYFHDKLRQFTALEAQRAALLRDREGECARLRGSVGELERKNERLNEDVATLDEIVRVQNAPQTPEVLQARLAEVLRALGRRQREQQWGDAPPEGLGKGQGDGSELRQVSAEEVQAALNECHIEIRRLHEKIKEMEKKHAEVVQTYRIHLLASMQGTLDPEVRKRLMRIIQRRPRGGVDGLSSPPRRSQSLSNIAGPLSLDSTETHY